MVPPKHHVSFTLRSRRLSHAISQPLAHNTKQTPQTMSYRNIKDASIDSKTGLPVYGMDAELAAKQAGKYDAGKEKEVRDWLKAVTGESVTGDFHGK